MAQYSLNHAKTDFLRYRQYLMLDLFLLLLLFILLFFTSGKITLLTAGAICGLTYFAIHLSNTLHRFQLTFNEAKPGITILPATFTQAQASVSIQLKTSSYLTTPNILNQLKKIIKKNRKIHRLTIAIDDVHLKHFQELMAIIERAAQDKKFKPDSQIEILTVAFGQDTLIKSYKNLFKKNVRYILDYSFDSIDWHYNFISSASKINHGHDAYYNSLDSATSLSNPTHTQDDEMLGVKITELPDLADYAHNYIQLANFLEKPSILDDDNAWINRWFIEKAMKEYFPKDRIDLLKKLRSRASDKEDCSPASLPLHAPGFQPGR